MQRSKVKHQLACPNCGTKFIRQWPNTKQSTCSRACKMAIYYAANRDKLNAISAEWGRRNRKRRLEIQRKWNNSEKGKVSKQKYYSQNAERHSKKALAKFHADPKYHAEHISRGQSRRILTRSDRKKECESCGAVGKLHCHHMDFNPVNRDLSNLQWLCISCHNLAHSECGLGKQ